MTAYILSQDNSAVIGTGQSGNWQDLSDSDSRVVAWQTEQSTIATVSAAVNAAIKAGINLTSTGTPSLNGNYSCGPSSVANVNAVMTYILTNPGTFPGGGATFPWYDSSGAAHIFPNTTVFQNFATAFATFVAQVQLYALSGSGSIPSNDITIP